LRDIFYTIVIVWLVYKIWQAFSPSSQKNPNQKRDGDVTVHNYSPDKKSNDKGEYVDYEEIKD